jgi:hypothetical protein
VDKNSVQIEPKKAQFHPLNHYQDGNMESFLKQYPVDFAFLPINSLFIPNF